MSRRALVLLVSGVLVLLLGLAAALVPVPYVALVPGPTSDTLGHSKGKPLIEIKGRQTYPTGGHLNFVTVAYRGGPGDRIDLFTALRGWFDSNVAIVPEETIFPKDESVKEVEKQNAAQMQSSQEVATAAALRELKIPINTHVRVQGTQPGMPAHGKLRAGDQISGVDGADIGNVRQISAAVGKRKPGEAVTFTVKRGDKEQDVKLVTVTAKNRPGKAAVGVLMQERYVFPFTVRISVGDVGGPSAGLMFSLGIYDKLTPGSLTGGRFVAGTGSIDPDGSVGPIGGIQQKMIAARKAGATVFLTPEDNCAEAAPAVPNGLRLVRVGKMRDALNALDLLRSGGGAPPGCTAGPKAN
jgi:PDZ domain-containing protein